MSEKWTSRKVVFSALAGFVAFGNSLWNWGLSQEQVSLVVVALLGYVGVEGLGDLAERWNKRK